MSPQEKYEEQEKIFFSKLAELEQSNTKPSNKFFDDKYLHTEVFIGGSGPLAAAYASKISELRPNTHITMVELGSQDSLVAGEHHKNSIKYQKDIDSFVNVIKGALQTVSAPPSDTYLSTLEGTGWAPSPLQTLVMMGNNPNQNPQMNLRAEGITRTVGGMSTHWTCACPKPHDDERKENPIPYDELNNLLDESAKLLNVHDDQYDVSIRHTVVKEKLIDEFKKRFPGRDVKNLPLAVERRTDNRQFVTWTGANTVLKKATENPNFRLLTETRVTRLLQDRSIPGLVKGVLLKDLNKNRDIYVLADVFIIACGAIGTPQILFNSSIDKAHLGTRLCEQSIAFCQIIMSRDIIEKIETDPRWKARVAEHHREYPKDPLPIPFDDPEPQVMIPYSTKFPWHVQVHRDAFSYGDVGPKADPRVIVDLRFFGKQQILEGNKVKFGKFERRWTTTWEPEWVPGVTDIYGLPQPTFEVVRSAEDKARDQRMMLDMCEVANMLGSFLPGSDPQFMEPGLALHITGTTRIGKDSNTSVADENSKVHDFKNLWVGTNGCIPDSTACNPTRTSVAIALKGAANAVEYLNRLKK